jgi:N-sulfoglucosamine sulfohydrolase
VADDTKYAAIKKELRNKLHQWRIEQGDKGQQTELEATEHLWRGE